MTVLRMSSLFLRTLREDPADAELPGHQLLVRAGYIRRAAPGIYSWLPLGLRVLRQVERIVREGIAAIIGNGYESNMPGFGGVLSDDEIRAILAYIKSTWPERERVYQEEVSAQAGG